MNLGKNTCRESQTFISLGESPPGHISGSFDNTPINILHKTLPTVLRYKKAQATMRKLGPLLETQEPGVSANYPAAYIHLEEALAPAQAVPALAPAPARTDNEPITLTHPLSHQDCHTISHPLRAHQLRTKARPHRQVIHHKELSQIRVHQLKTKARPHRQAVHHKEPFNKR